MVLSRIVPVLIVTIFALPAQERPYVLKAQRLFDSVSGKIAEPGMVVVSEGKIQSVGSATVPAGANVIDLGDATLLPGFIDSHTHLTDDVNPDYNGAQLLDWQRTIPEKAIRSPAKARVTPIAGFTTVRNLGSQDFLDVGLRNSIKSGIVPGPRMDLLGLKDSVGVLRPGIMADVVAVPGNPVSDIKATQNVFFVMKDGKVYRNDRPSAR